MNTRLKCTELQYSKNKEIVDQYFYAWINHDSNIVREIFHKKSPYVINRFHGRTLRGIDEICSYWERNKNRQRDVNINYKLLSVYGDRVQASFKTMLFDSEESQTQIIEGIINFRIRKNSIKALKESYNKQII